MNVIKDNEFVECDYCKEDIHNLIDMNLCKSRMGFLDRDCLRYERCNRILCKKCEYCSSHTDRIRHLKHKVDKCRDKPRNAISTDYKDYISTLKSNYDIDYE